MYVKKSHLLIILAVFAISLVLFLAYYFIFTTRGSSSIAKLALSKYIPSGSVDFKEAAGNLIETLSYENVVFDDLKFLPKGSVLKIQKLDIFLSALSLSALNVNVHNGRLRMPNFDTILFYGAFREGNLDINVYSKKVGVRETLDLFTQSSNLKKISGTISDLDAYIKGTLLEPELTGTFNIDKLTRNGFSITNFPGGFNLHLKDIKDELKLFGSVSLNSGVISGPKTALIDIQESKIIFNGDPRSPSLDLKGTSTVEWTKINIILKGSFEKPELKLSSDPPRSQERLLIMLATGKSWEGTEKALSQGQLSPDLAKDFLDYFVFSGSGSKIAQRFGISDISLKYDEQKQGFGIKKSISEKIDTTYELEQTKSKEQKMPPTHKVGAEYKLTEEISIGAEKELNQIDKNEQPQDKAFIKYKKEF